MTLFSVSMDELMRVGCAVEFRKYGKDGVKALVTFPGFLPHRAACVLCEHNNYSTLCYPRGFRDAETLAVFQASGAHIQFQGESS
jgi:hypothetical protein